MNIGCVFAVSLIALFAAAAQTNSQDEKDPNRPACTSAYCRKIQAYLKVHYCGESPAGNGPDNGCEIRVPKQQDAGIELKADYECGWNEKKELYECTQQGLPSPVVRGILERELHRLGLPADAKGRILFRLLESSENHWFLAEADYTRVSGDNMDLCDVIAIIDKNSNVTALRKVAFQRTDADKPAVTTWSALGLADVDGDGQLDIVLEGDAYENHWIEVVTMKHGAPQTVFSGLGYYL